MSQQGIGYRHYVLRMLGELRDLGDEIDVATQGLLRSVGQLTDADVIESSLLPGWTRGHVLTHISRSADAMTALLEWATTGVPTLAYASQEARDAAIDAGARRRVGDLLADLRTSADRFQRQTEAVPPHGWEQPVDVLGGTGFPAAQLLVRRWVEVELHHTDLDIGYSPERWPSRFATLALPEPMRTQREHRKTWDMARR
jgi:maleylpyruvate isomerase